MTLHSMNDIAAFLEACWAERGQQLDEDERAALAATVGPWQWGPRPGKIGWALSGPSVPYGGFILGVTDAGCPSVYDSEHIARFDPQRMLAEVEQGRRDIAAKRRILEEYDTTCGEVRNPTSAEHRANARARQFALEQVIAYLAQPYAGLPGWRDEWAL